MDQRGIVDYKIRLHKSQYHLQEKEHHLQPGETNNNNIEATSLSKSKQIFALMWSGRIQAIITKTFLKTII